MSNESNGYIRGAAASANIASERCTTQESLAESAEDFAVKAIIGKFHGFERRPAVVVERIDISPYLNIRNMTTVEPPDLGPKNNGSNAAIDSRFFKCRVNVARDDLWDLRASVLFSMDKNYAFVSCKICKKLYPDLRKLRNHQEAKHLIVYQHDSKPQKRVSFSDHVIVHVLKEYHKCRKCSKIFEDYAHLKTHMKKDHRKRKCYMCNYCDKQFVDRTIFKVHIKLHCDVCLLLLPNKSKYVEHRRNVCRVIKMHKCRTCNESFFKFMDLKDHSYEHTSALFICDICKDQFETKCGVSHHIAFLHSKKPPVSLYGLRNLGNDRLYLCNFCEETSVDKDTVEKHVDGLPDLSNRVMTGYKDYYFCDQCLMKFSTEKEMLQHKWSHFLKSSGKPRNDKEGQDNIESLENNIAEEKPHTKVTKKYFNINQPIPDYLKPKLVLERVKVPLPKEDKKDKSSIVKIVDAIDSDTKYRTGFVTNIDELKKPIMDPHGKHGSRKVLLSKHQCELCTKYFSTGYCLRRHLQQVHNIAQTNSEDNLHCPVCEETFVWPSLLASHRCIRSHIPEMVFDDARPEILFDNLMSQDGLSNDDYMDYVDFEIPEPIVELRESNGSCLINDNPLLYNQLVGGNTNGYVQKSTEAAPVQPKSGYKLILQEVPIEF